jgi:hypothetical protein
MKIFVPLAALVWLSLAGGIALGEAPDAAEAQEAASRFYRVYLKLKPSGLPTEEQMKEFGPLLTKEIVDLLSSARREQQKFIKENPDEKPPWIEGNLFASNYEGVSSFKLGEPTLHEDKASIPVYLEHREGSTVVRWIDVIVLQRAKEAWQVWDILMNAPWDFKSGPSLRAMLSAK